MLTFIINFEINNTFEQWSKIYDADTNKIKSFGITPIFRGVNQTDRKKVLVIMQAEDGVLAVSYTHLPSPRDS